MRKIYHLMVGVIATLCLSSCAAPALIAHDGVSGVIYAGQTQPLVATGAPIGTKVGESKATNVLGFSFGDGSVQAAARKAGIKEISTIDVKTTNVFGLVVVRKYIVCGE